ncbi:MAG: peptidoglycan DD-metalloendopeptidase family protein [Pacificimonas sp.]
MLDRARGFRAFRLVRVWVSGGRIFSNFVRAIGRWFPDRELYLRSDGQVRFLRVSQRFQLSFVALAMLLGIAWAVSSTIMLVRQVQAEALHAEVEAKAHEVANTERAVAGYRGSVEERAARIEARQAELEAIARDHFGNDLTIDEGGGETGAAGADVIPGAGRLATAEARQLAFLGAARVAAKARFDRMRTQVTSLGLSPARYLTRPGGQGGPLIPAMEDGADDLVALEETLAAITQLSNGLSALPTLMPSTTARLTSRYGVRRDPLTGRAAMHMGQDFGGAHGEAILAAADGIVVKARRLAGYGKLVVIDHGRGVKTRYAHLSRIDVRPGQRVAQGERLGGMGSTGRSTGTHLHFEVRVDGKAVDPRPYLEAHAYVLEAKNHAFGGTVNAG